MEAVFKSAILRGTREKASPCVGITQELQTRHREVRHHPALPWQEVPAFIEVLRARAPRSLPATRLAFEFLILTATRSSEVRGAVWSEFDLDNAIWIIPKERMKTRTPHRLPLSPRCLAILREAHALNPDGVLVFEGAKNVASLKAVGIILVVAMLVALRAIAYMLTDSFDRIAGWQSRGGGSGIERHRHASELPHRRRDRPLHRPN